MWIVSFSLVVLSVFLYFFFWKTLILVTSIYLLYKFKQLWEFLYCWKISRLVPKGFNVIIIGCGFSGIHAGIECKKRGIPFTIYEKRDNLGGTWYNNQYPGCHCDAPSSMYSYSFEPYPWPSAFSDDSLIRKYLSHCVNKYGIADHIQFNTEISSIIWNDKKKFWSVKTTKETLVANVVIDGTGILHVPHIPEFKGQESYKGKIYHSTNLSSKVKYDGLKVSVIGSAASAIQMIPEIAKTASQLNIFQRSPNWVVGSMNDPHANPIKFLIHNVTIVSYIYRVLSYIRSELLFYYAFSKQSKLREDLESGIRQYVQSLFGPEMSEKIIPDYPFGCKRVLISHNFNYYKALQLPNVKLITEPIHSVSETGIQTDRELYESDMIIYATGFRPNIKTFQIIGKNNTQIREPGITYWGITYPNMPNFFMVLGPNTTLGHNSVLWMAECEVNYIMNCISYMFENSVKELSVKPEKSDKWYKDNVKSVFKDKVWTGSCRSWYKSSKDGEIWTLWPDQTYKYWWGTTSARWSIGTDYNII